MLPLFFPRLFQSEFTRMNATESVFEIFILLQLSIGISGNVFLLLLTIRTVSTSHKSYSSDLIYAHLALTNNLILLTRGIPGIFSIWGLWNFLDDAGCKLLIYIHRVARSLAICTTCLLSIFQAITISPSTSKWAGIKAKLPKCIIPCFLSFWALSLLIDVSAPIYIIGPQNSTRDQYTFMLKHCSLVNISAEALLINTCVISFRDLLFMGLMSTASGYMVFVLHKHHQQVQHLHGSGCSPREIPEMRAAKCVIILMVLYLLLYGLETVMLTAFLNMRNKSLQVRTNIDLSIPFSIISPFLVIHSNRRMRTCGKGKSHS
ncbi:vomeronasal 1 receptor ornAnaV1R3261 [Ornithorhynchus anatinus]|uniref:Vomeronasal type-1 receptor n=1 Tax=Ornithorhynchus anatinus TaxID=9258 RepID=F7G9N5_ORNAN|nr:vomeronasal 1 receptor ornAnaV1R3261 [Ornithorhynchus anatinus]